MADLNEMKRHYEEAGKCYDAAKRAPDQRTREAYQKAGDEAYAKGAKEAEKHKSEINKEACGKARECYEKQEAAYKKGDFKSAREYQQQGDKTMSDAKDKTKEIDKQQKESESRARSHMEGLEKTRYR